MNAGPNATTFNLALEFFPTGVRAFASGFSIVAAKAGAMFVVFTLPQVKEQTGVAGMLTLTAVVSALGAAITAMLAATRDIPEGWGARKSA